MSSDPAAFVLDNFALLAYLNGEKGMERVREVSREAVAFGALSPQEGGRQFLR